MFHSFQASCCQTFRLLSSTPLVPACKKNATLKPSHIYCDQASNYMLYSAAEIDSFLDMGICQPNWRHDSLQREWGCTFRYSFWNTLTKDCMFSSLASSPCTSDRAISLVWSVFERKAQILNWAFLNLQAQIKDLEDSSCRSLRELVNVKWHAMTSSANLLTPHQSFSLSFKTLEHI